MNKPPRVSVNSAGSTRPVTSIIDSTPTAPNVFSPHSPLPPVGAHKKSPSVPFDALRLSDDPTYISSLESDVYQVQQRLDKLQRELDRVAHPASGSHGSASRRRSELETIKKGTSEVDLILQQQLRDGPVMTKLRLLELLSLKMAQLETQVLRITDRCSMDGAATKTYTTSATSLSRLPSFLSLVDRVFDLSQQLDAQQPIAEGSATSCAKSPTHHNRRTSSISVPHSLSPTNSASAASLPSPSTPPPAASSGLVTFPTPLDLSKAMTVLEMKLLTLEEDMGLDSPVFGSTPDTLEGLHKRILRTTEHLDLCKLKGVRKLNADIMKMRKQIEGASKASTAAANVPEEVKVQLELQAEKIQAGENTIKQLQTQLDSLKKELADSNAKLKASAQLPALLQKAEKNAKEELDRRRQDEDQHQKEIDGVRKSFEDQMTSNQNEIQQLKEQLSKQDEQVATLMAQLDKQQDVARRAVEEKKVLEAKTADDMARFKEQTQNLQTRLDLANQRVDALSASDAAHKVQMDNNLKQEVKELNDQLSKLQKSFASSELYHKERCTLLEKQVQELRVDGERSKDQAVRNQDTYNQLIKLKEDQITNLNVALKEHAKARGFDPDSFEEVLREEIRVMKAAYELKVSKLKEELALQQLQHSSEIRKLSEKWSAERKVYEVQQKKLLARIKEADPNASVDLYQPEPTEAAAAKSEAKP